jgi:hypothetical protein
MDSRRFNSDPDAPQDKARYSSESERLGEGNRARNSFILDEVADKVAARSLAALEVYDSDSDRSLQYDGRQATRSIAQCHGPEPTPSIVRYSRHEPSPSVVLREPAQPARSIERQSRYPRDRSLSSSSEDGEVMLKANSRFRKKILHRRYDSPGLGTAAHKFLLETNQDYKWQYSISASWRVFYNKPFTHPLQLVIFQPRMLYFAPIEFHNVYFPGSRIRHQSKDTIFVQGRDQSRNMPLLIKCSSENQSENRWNFEIIPSDDHNFILSALEFGLRHGTLELQTYGETHQTIARSWNRINDWALTLSLKIDNLISYNVGELFITEASAKLHKRYTTASSVFIKDGALRRHRDQRRSSRHLKQGSQRLNELSVESPSLRRLR